MTRASAPAPLRSCAPALLLACCSPPALLRSCSPALLLPCSAAALLCSPVLLLSCSPALPLSCCALFISSSPPLRSWPSRLAAAPARRAPPPPRRTRSGWGGRRVCIGRRTPTSFLTPSAPFLPEASPHHPLPSRSERPSPLPLVAQVPQRRKRVSASRRCALGETGRQQSAGG